MTNLEADQKSWNRTQIALPEWVKDYGAIALVALFMFSAIWNYAQDKYFLQILCSIGVAIVVATALNLVVGYIGQVALGHAGFVAIGGYVTGLLIGRLNGDNNWIDFLYLRKQPGYSPGERSDYAKATAARVRALENVNNLLLMLLVIAIVVTLGLGAWLWLRWQHVKRNEGKFERHFWHSPTIMRFLFYVVTVGGGILTVICYIANLTASLPSIVTLVVLVLTIALSYLCWGQQRKMAQPNTPLRPGFWDNPATLKSIFQITVVLGAITIVALAVFYFVGFWVLQNFWVALALGAIVTGIFGWLLALPSLRVKGPYLSMVTIAFGLIVYQVVNSSALQPTLGSQNGLVQIPFPISERRAATDIIQQPSDNVAATYELFLTALIILACAVVTLYLIRNFVRSRWGRALIALRENEIGAGSVGINVTRMKTIAFVLSASIAGIGGVLNAYSFSFVGPSVTQLDRSIAFVTMLILGGVGTLYGPVLGAIAITLLPEMLKNLQLNKVDTDVFSLVGNVSFFLLLALLVGWFVVRQFKLEMPALRMGSGWLIALVGLGFGIPATLAVAGTIDVPVVAGTPNLFLQLFQWATVLAGLALVGWMVVYGYLAARRGERAAHNLATAIGFVVAFNSIEILRAFFNSIGGITGIGFKKTDFGIDGWVIILLYFAFIVAGLVVTTSQMRKLMVRTLAAACVMFIPEAYRLIIGLAHNSASTSFDPTLILLTIYGAILLYFLFLVPKGIGGLMGQLIEQYLPTQRRINFSVLQAPTPSADAGVPDTTAAPFLAFRRQRGAHEEVLRVARVTRDFKGLRAVDQVDMKLDRGDIHALIGPNGAGKTTVLNLISGLYPVSDGQIFFRGERVDSMKPHQVAETGISRTFQNLQVFGDMTVLENVMVGFHLHTREGFWASLLGLPAVKREEERIKALSMQLLEFVSLGDRAYHKAKDLPYGYQRLLEIARALAVEPEILLLDEPAAGLNPHEIGDMDRLIRKIKNEGVTVLLIEHHMDLVMEISDEITVLDYGRRIAEGLPAQVQNNQKVKDAYFGPEVVINARS